MDYNYTKKLYTDLKKNLVSENKYAFKTMGRNPFNLKDFSVLYRHARSAFLSGNPDVAIGKDINGNPTEADFEEIVRAITDRNEEALRTTITSIDAAAGSLPPEKKQAWNEFRSYLVRLFLPKQSLGGETGHVPDKQDYA